MLTLMKRSPWKGAPRSVVNEEFRHYWIAQNRRYRRRRLVERLGLSALAAVGGCAAVWAFLSYGPALPSLPSLPSLSFGSSPAAAQVSVGPFRNCAAARAAGAAPLHRGQPGYAYHLDADGDGIACEWAWRNWFR
jgi:hypothetical protein